MLQAIFFDFNGVIIDDEPLQLKAYQETLGAEGFALTDEDYYNSLGMDDETFVRAAYERAERELDEDKLRAVIERKSELHGQMIAGELPLFPGVVNFVKAVARRYPLGVVSMARREEIDDVLNRAGLARHFAVVVSAERGRPCKPDPYCYRRALELLNVRRRDSHVLPVSPEECLVIEDSPPGVLAARRAGMRALGVANTVPDAALREAGAQVVTRNLGDWTDDALHHVFEAR